MKKKKAAVVGHICLDITPVFPEEGGNSTPFVPGGLIHVENADIHTGGMVANTGLAMKFFGTDVSLIGKIGSDRFGQIILSELEKWQAHEDMIRSFDGTTSYSIVLAPPGADRCFLHCPGCNHTFSGQDIPWDKLKDCCLFHFGYPTLMASMYENQGAGLEELMTRASAMGMATSMDLSSVDPLSEAGRQDWRGILEKALKHTDIFLPSAEEILFMMDWERFENINRAAKDGNENGGIHIVRDIYPLGEMLIGFGAGIVIIKCDAAGLYFKTAGRERLKDLEEKTGISLKGWEDQEGFVPSFRPARVAAATGAGDTSIAAFLSALLKGYPLEECLDLMAAAGACCVESYDALGGLKPLDELREKIRGGWERQGQIPEK